MTDAPFLRALMVSPTFLSDLAVYGAGLLVLLAALGMLLPGRRFSLARCRHLHRDQTGAATAVDFTLTFPLFLFVLLLIVQLAMVVNTSLIVHYAAYSAARSALITIGDISLLTAKGIHLAEQRQPQSKRLRAVTRYSLNKVKANKNALNAARFALIAASPVNATGAGNIPSETLALIVTESGLGRDAPLAKQAAYAYDPLNTTVEISHPEAAVPSAVPSLGDIAAWARLADWGMAAEANTWPIHATVTYRMRLGVPLASRVLGKAEAGEYYRPLVAEIDLL